MQLSHSLVSFAMLSLATAAPIAPHLQAEMEAEMQIYARHTPSLTCATGVHIISVTGPGIWTIGKRDVTDMLSESIMDAIPGSTRRTMPYDKTATKRSNKAITGGSKNLLDWMDLYHNHCPESKIVILGDSAGATILMNTLCGASAPYPATPALSPEYSKFILASIMYGDQTVSPDQSTKQGTWSRSDGLFERSTSEDCAAFATRSYCDPHDPDCYISGPISEIRSAPNHPEQYDTTALEFVKQQFYLHG